MRRFLSYCLFLLFTLSVWSQQRDSVRVSLITCSPGTEIYSLYGHTAVRCENFTRDADIVFNYGVFSFNQPHFMWRFLRGQCDYMVEPIPWRYFVREYEERGSSVTGQVLDLTPDEAFRLFVMLMYNSKPENCEYRYNFLYNNCTTMVRDKIEQCVEGEVLYPDTFPRYTYRQILHQYTRKFPWDQEGNDILLGAAVDTILTDRAAMFAPEMMMKYAAGAVVRDKRGNVRPLVLRTEVLVQPRLVEDEGGFPLPPTTTMFLILLACVGIVVLEYRLRRVFWGWDVVLLLLQGVAGLLLVFMFFFSEHPAVDSNWQIWVLNPLALAGIPLVVKSSLGHRKTLWHAVYFVFLTLFIVFSPWIPQDFGNIIVPLTLCLLTRPISYYLYYRRQKL